MRKKCALPVVVQGRAGVEAVLLKDRKVLPVRARGLKLKGMARRECLLGKVWFLMGHEVGALDINECRNIAQSQKHC